MYKSFILPIFDYGDVIWGNCTQAQANILENLHLEGLRIITGLVKGTNHEKLYTESGFTSLSNRRDKHKLIFYYKIVYGLVPEYLQNLLPPLVSEINPHHRRRLQERIIPHFKTELYRNSFFPSATYLWNSLPENVQIMSSISDFKRFVNSDVPSVPPRFYLGKRKEQIIHCRLRNNMSDLNFDLLNRHLKDDPSCSCGFCLETTEHYLLHCPLYNNARAATLAALQPDIPIQDLLKGNDTLGQDENENIFSAVQNFILLSQRF